MIKLLIILQSLALSIGATQRSLNTSLGFISDDYYTITAGFDLPYSGTDKPKMLSINGGKQFNINEYSITPLIGAGYLKYSDFTDYDRGGQIKEIEKTAMVYTLEAGRNIYNGMLFTQVKYYNSNWYYGVGFKLITQ